MSQVHNPKLHTLHSIGMVGSAIVTNHFFHNGLKEWFIFVAVASSVINQISMRWAPKNETAKHSFFRVTTCLVATTSLIYIVSNDLLRERASMNVPSDVISFCLMETFVSMLFAIISHYITPSFQQRIMRASAQLLPCEEKDCTEEIETLYTKSYTVQSLYGVPFRADIFQRWRRDFSSMTEEQLLWHNEVVNNDTQYSEEELYALNKALHALNLPMNWGAGMSEQLIQYADQNSHCRDLVISYFQNNPIAYGRLEGILQQPWLDGITVPDPIEYIKTIDKKRVSWWSLLDFEFIWQEKKDSFWDELSISQQITLSIAAHRKTMCPFELNNPDSFTKDMLTQCLFDQASIEWFHRHLQEDLRYNAILTDDDRRRANAHFAKHGLSTVKSPESILYEYKQPIGGHVYKDRLFLGYSIQQWRNYFETYPESWKNLFNSKRTIFVNYFMYHGVEILPKEEINTRLLARPLKREIETYDRNQRIWLQQYFTDLLKQRKIELNYPNHSETWRNTQAFISQINVTPSGKAFVSEGEDSDSDT